MVGDYHFCPHDCHYYTTAKKGDETEVIRTPSGPGRWNTSALAIASSVDERVACRIAGLIAQHGLGFGH